MKECGRFLSVPLPHTPRALTLSPQAVLPPQLTLGTPLTVLILL